MKTLSRFIYNIFLLTNIFLMLYYTYECYNFYTDNYIPDGWRFLLVYLVADIIFLILFLLTLLTKNRKFLFIIAAIALLQNLPIGFGISLVSQVGLIFSLLISIYLSVLKRNIYSVSRDE